MKRILIIAIACLSGLVDFAQVGIGTLLPNSILDVRGAVSVMARTAAGSTSLTASDHCLIFNGSSAATFILPDATTCPGRSYCIKYFSPTLPAPVLTVVTAGSQKIDGSAAWILNEPNETVTITSDGVNWYVFNQDVPVAATGANGGGWNEGGNSVTGAKAVGTISGFDLPFITSNTERMRITGGGNVGIGTSAPVYPLQVNAIANPLYLGGVQTGSNTDTILTIANGIVRQLLTTSLASSSANAWALPGNAGTVSGTNFLGVTDNTSLTIRTNNISHAVLDSTGNLGIGTAIAFTTGGPEKLLVNAGNTTSFNAMIAKGSVNNYFQLNINNQSPGANASSDLVATADNGNEIINFADMGINSSANTAGVMGNAGDAYLYTTGNNLVVGTASPGMAAIFLTGGTTVATNERMRINGAGNVGINDPTPSSTLQLRGSLGLPVTTKTSGGTVASTDFSTICNNTSGSITVNLPTAAGIQGRIYVIKKISAAGNNVTIDGFGSETIDGGMTYSITTQYSYVMIQSDGTNWYILSKH
jgi:hypothetical protein